MTFKDAVNTCLREKYFSIEGRAARSEYWFFWLFYVIATIILQIADSALFPAAGLGPLSTLFSVLIFIPFITVGVRRLHDRDMSGWWMLLMLVPLIGSIILLVLYLMPGTDGPNKYGPDPTDHDDGTGGDGIQTEDLTVTAESSIPRVGRE